MQSIFNFFSSARDARETKLLWKNLQQFTLSSHIFLHAPIIKPAEKKKGGKSRKKRTAVEGNKTVYSYTGA